MTHYNTTHEAGGALAKYQDQALSQEERIMAFYAEAPAFLYTPSEIAAQVFGGMVPLTSVRRAMTDLTKDGRLIKTEKKREGVYGRPEYCWRRRIGPGQQRSLAL